MVSLRCLATISWRRNPYLANVQIRIVYVGTRRWKGDIGGTYDFRREGRGRKAQGVVECGVVKCDFVGKNARVVSHQCRFWI